jgi:hypothetical protein
MASPPVAGPLASDGVALRSRALRLSVLPLSLGAVAIVVGAVLGQVWAGVLFAGGLLLGAGNGMAAQLATVWMATTDGVDRGAIVRSSLRRLAIVSVVAVAIAFLARPTGWVLLLGLAAYQLIATAATAGATMRELRRG